YGSGPEGIGGPARIRRIIVQLTMSTANSIDVLANMPLTDLFELYDAVSFELQAIHEERERQVRG
ncbi:hypothetical protein, partial [Anaerotruncus rubiinfantis]|uniref:hypothetical protein n=1 Tax=Anaerotruncus rubiinfantis TaxID=1720200 RepID=UPI0034A49D52